MNKYVYLMISISLFVYTSLISMESQTQECDHESLSDAILRNKLERQFLWKNIGAKGKRNPTEEDYIDLCLDGKRYTAISRLGAGQEGDVYKIKDKDDNIFALKVYHLNKTDRQDGDLLAVTKTNFSRAFLNIPIKVNKEYHYSIYPELYLPYRLKPNQILLNETEANVRLSTAKDGLSLGDNWNEDNYMYDKNGKLWRIDFGSLEDFNAPKKKRKAKVWDFSSLLETQNKKIPT